MRIFFYGRLHLNYIFLFPSFSAVDVHNENDGFKIDHRWYQAVLFGYSINIDVPTTRHRRAYVFSVQNIIDAICKLFA